ncbi:MAG: hypothetical protein JWO53_85 [Chlamydiia bacterium]|nr:hypothetical protein [Chlamydiia bacterium]
MAEPPSTCIIRHSRENLKKCSLRGLEGRCDFNFFVYPNCCTTLPDLSNYVVLDLDGPALSKDDSSRGLILIDATWRLAGKMVQQLKELYPVPKRSIPPGFKTAYPRRQDDCSDPTAGLASIEALYIAYRLLGRNGEFLLKDYYWKELFLQKNELNIAGQ